MAGASKACIICPIRKTTHLLLLLYIATRTVMALSQSANRDIQTYFAAADAAARGIRPYIDHPLEYPPGALLLFVVPRLMSADLEVYAHLFAAEMLLFDLLILLALWRLPPSVRGSRSPPTHDSDTGIFVRVAGYLILSVSLFQLVVQRFDVALAALLLYFLLATICSSRGWIADLLLALGIWVKLVPLILLPLYLGYLHARDRGLGHHWHGSIHWLIHRGARRLGIICACLLLLFFPFAVLSGQRVASFLLYHADRGLQIESTYSSLLLVLYHLIPLELQLQFSHGAMHLSRASTPIMLAASTWISVLAQVLIAAWLVITIQRARVDRERNAMFIRGVLVSLFSFMSTAKVFSLQYLIWPAPILALHSSDLRHPNDRSLLIALAIYILTAIHNRFLYDDLIQLQLLPATVLLLRNILVIGLVVHLICAWKQASAFSADQSR